jgi:5-methyltetrahydropteroyltriglutamate--homocysteine methyltransferase
MPDEYRAEHVGSLLRPPELLAARADRDAGRISTEQLREVEDRAALDAIELQRQVGLQVFTDGEMRRENWMASVMETIGGLVTVERDQSFQAPWFRGETREGEKAPAEETDLPPVVVGERIYRKETQSTTEADFLKAHAPGRFKITMASPTIGVLLWRPGISDEVYSAPEQLLQDYLELQVQDVEHLIDAGVDWIQIDSLAYIPNVDPKIGAERAAMGLDLDANITQTIQVDNMLIRAARAKSPDVTVAMHFCRGNNRSAWAAEGGYEPIAEQVFGQVEVDRFLLEYDSARAGGFEPLRFVPAGKTVVLGLVSSKVPELESQDDLRRRIDEAAQHVPMEQLALSPQCGFASTKGGNLLTVDEERRKLELVVDTAQKVWG